MTVDKSCSRNRVSHLWTINPRCIARCRFFVVEWIDWFWILSRKTKFQLYVLWLNVRLHLGMTFRYPVSAHTHWFSHFHLFSTFHAVFVRQLICMLTKARQDSPAHNDSGLKDSYVLKDATYGACLISSHWIVIFDMEPIKRNDSPHSKFRTSYYHKPVDSTRYLPNRFVWVFCSPYPLSSKIEVDHILAWSISSSSFNHDNQGYE